MANTYTELIERLRGHVSDYDCGKTQDFQKVTNDCMRAADAIETLSKGINAYSDEAFKRAQECADLRRRITELEGLLAGREIETEEQAADAPDILYICDRRACDSCDQIECMHTRDIRHARNFELEGDIMVEQFARER